MKLLDFGYEMKCDIVMYFENNRNEKYIYNQSALSMFKDECAAENWCLCDAIKIFMSITNGTSLSSILSIKIKIALSKKYDEYRKYLK